MKLRSLAPLALAAAALLAAPVQAQGSPANALREWGLLGWWSLRCDLPVSASNLYYGYVVDGGGRAYHERDLGDPKRNDRSAITSVELRADGTIALVINFTSIGQVRHVVFTKEQGRIRAMFNRGPNNDISVNNGIFRHNSQPTPWQYKCR